MDETTAAESVSLLRKLEFDKVARHAAGFCISAMGRDLVMEMGLPDECKRELVRVLELKNFLLEGEPLPFSRLPDTRHLLDKLEVLDSWLDPAELLDMLRAVKVGDGAVPPVELAEFADQLGVHLRVGEDAHDENQRSG